MKIFKPETIDNNILYKINDILDGKTMDKTWNYEITFSEMGINERLFLNGLIRKIKPKNILEVGVAAGGSSLIVLNAIRDLKKSFLYSIDYSEAYYRDKEKKTGFLVSENLPSLINKWKLSTGSVASNFMSEIKNCTGGGILIFVFSMLLI